MAQTTEPKLREAIARVKGKEYPRWILDCGIVHGKRTRRSFKSKTEAERLLKDWRQKQEIHSERQNILARRIGEKADRLSADELLDAVRALELLPSRVSLEQAARFYLEHTEPAGSKCAVKNLESEYREAKRYPPVRVARRTKPGGS